MRFWLGTHMPQWLGKTDTPLFVSRRRLERMKRLPRALGPWALDSGGFTELSMPPHRWTITADEYVETVERYRREVGGLAWAAPMDHMCEPFITDKTGLSVREHQERTVQNYLDLRGRGPFIPVLQGWERDDYAACADLYAEAGVDLAAEPLVGLGTVCRRQGSEEIRRVVGLLSDRGVSLHGFGVKKRGLPAAAHLLESADSMAWSTRGRMAWQLEGHRQLCGGLGHHRGSCANCLAWAQLWREQVVDGLGLFGTAGGRGVMEVG